MKKYYQEGLETGSLFYTNFCVRYRTGREVTTMSEQNEFGRTTAEELEKAFETEEQEEQE